jgi:hypothetical protein
LLMLLLFESILTFLPSFLPSLLTYRGGKLVLNLEDG